MADDVLAISRTVDTGPLNFQQTVHFGGSGVDGPATGAVVAPGNPSADLKAELETLAVATAVDPRNLELQLALARMLANSGRVADALAGLANAVELEPLVTRLYLLAGQILWHAGRPYEAIEWMVRGVAAQPADVDLRLRLVRMLIEARWPERAAAELSHVVRLDPLNATAFFDLSSVLFELGHIDAAATAVERAIELQPGNENFIRRSNEIATIQTGQSLAKVPGRGIAISTVLLARERFDSFPKCIVYTNFLDQNESLGQHTLRDVYVARMHRMHSISMRRLPRGAKLYVPSNEDFLVGVKNKIIQEQTRTHWGEEDLRRTVEGCQTIIEVQGSLLVAARWGIRTWGHWLGELLPRIVAAETFDPNRFHYVMPGDLPRDLSMQTVKQSLEYYGITEDKLLLAAPGTTYICDQLTVVDSVWSSGRLHSSVAELMRAQAARRHPTRPGPERVALVRRRRQTRVVENGAEVEAFLAERGWTIIDPQDLDFASQVDLFRNARQIASVLGSGLTGLMYAPEGIRVLTFAPAEWGDSFFYALMQERRALLADIRGPSTASEPREVPVASFHIDLAKVEEGLAALDAARKL